MDSPALTLDQLRTDVSEQRRGHGDLRLRGETAVTEWERAREFERLAEGAGVP
jgi:hypothetical protein